MNPDLEFDRHPLTSEHPYLKAYFLAQAKAGVRVGKLKASSAPSAVPIVFFGLEDLEFKVNWGEVDAYYDRKYQNQQMRPVISLQSDPQKQFSIDPYSIGISLSDLREDKKVEKNPPTDRQPELYQDVIPPEPE